MSCEVASPLPIGNNLENFSNCEIERAWSLNAYWDSYTFPRMSTPRLPVTCENIHILCYCHNKLIFSLVTHIPEISISTSSVKTFFFLYSSSISDNYYKTKQTKKTQINNPNPLNSMVLKTPNHILPTYLQIFRQSTYLT